MTENSLEFEELPLIEVALRRVPKKHLPMGLHFILKIWEEVKSEFTQIGDLDAIETLPAKLPNADFEQYPTKGCTLVNSDQGIYVSIQPDLLAVRWAKTNDNSYPRFQEVQRAADQVVKAIDKVGLEDFEPILVNLAYANRVGARIDEGLIRPDPWPLSDEWSIPSMRGMASMGDVEAVFSGPNGVDRRLAIRRQQGDMNSALWYLLLTVAGKKVSDGESATIVEDQVHETLIQWFPEVLSEAAKKAYGLKS